ncbi:hypothetical protein NHF46_00795 [Arthrobacter alpinus]|nr:hypothetical protein [Arthrobacter alpinus]
MGLQWYQLGLVGVGVLAGTIASATGGPPALIFTMPVWLGAILFGVLQYQRIPYPVWAYAATVFLWRQQVGQTKFLAKPEQPRPAGQLALPGGLGSLELRQTKEGAAFVVDRQGHEAVAVLRCTTTSFTLLDDDDKAYAVQAWSRVQTAMAQRPAVARLAIQDYTVPYPSTALRKFYDRAKAPTRIEDVSWGDKSYLDLIAEAGSAMVHELLVCLVIDTAKARRRIRDAGGSLAGMEHVVASEVEALTTGLKTHGVSVDEWLPGNKLTAVMRGAFDPDAVTRLAAVKQGTETAPLSAGPMAVEEHWSYLRTDSGFHQTFWIAEWPRQQVFPGSFTPWSMWATSGTPSRRLSEPSPLSRPCETSVRRTRLTRPAGASTPALTGHSRASNEPRRKRSPSVRTRLLPATATCAPPHTSPSPPTLSMHWPAIGRNSNRRPPVLLLSCGCWPDSNGRRSSPGRCHWEGV